MGTRTGSLTTSTYLFPFMLAFLLSNIASPRWTDAALTAEVEGPAENQQVAGVGIIRGWAFSDTNGVSISQVTLAIDGNEASSIPCCSVRGDVAQAFPQFPATNTTNSGFGITFNYGLLSSGAHMIGVTIRDSSGEQRTFTRPVMVVRPGNVAFLDLVDLSAASAQRQGQEVVVSGIRIRDKASQQTSRIDSRLQWFQNLQGFGMVEATTIGAASITVPATTQKEAREQTGAENSGLQASVESPINGQGASGIAVIRGWAFAKTGRSIRRVQLFVDGNAGPTIPCCSLRGDVAAAFPNEANALNSGFGITFNYGLLAAGVHTVTVEVEDSAGAKKIFTRGVLVKRPGEFVFLQDLDLSAATVRIANGTLVVDGAIAKDQGTGQTATRILRYRFDLGAQGFNLVEDYTEEITIQTFSCDINGSTTNLAALVQTPGPDGISLPEAVTAANNTTTPTSTLITFPQAGTLASCSLPPITQGNLTIDGDVNSDGTPDVTIEGARITIVASNTTIRGLRLTNGPGDGILVSTPSGTSNISLSNIALIENILDGFQGTPGANAIRVVGGNRGANSIRLRQVLVSTNRISNSPNAVEVVAGLATSSQNIAEVAVVDNTIIGGSYAISLSATGFSVMEGGGSNKVIGGIYDNRIQQVFVPISVSPGTGVQDTVDVIIANNLLESGSSGIEVNGSVAGGVGSVVMTKIQGNTVRMMSQRAITLTGSFGGKQTTVDAEVTDNATSIIQFNGISAGGSVFEGDDDIVMVRVQKNVVQSAGLSVSSSESNNLGTGGIAIEGGHSTTRGMVDANVEDNSVVQSRGTGVTILGGLGGSGKLVTGTIARNQVESADSGILLSGGVSASANAVDVSVSNNIVEKSSAAGINVQGGTAPAEASGPARNNSVTGIIRHNEIQQVQGPMISVIGGTDAITGEVVGNLAKQTIIGTLASNVRCEDGLPGNRAECTFAANIEASLTLRAQTQIPDEKRTIPLPLPQAFVQQLQERKGVIESRVEELRERAEKIPDDRLRQRLVKVGERLESLQEKLAKRMAGETEAVHAP